MHPIIGLVGPSGCGKTTLIKAALTAFPDRLGIVRSLTTRPKRDPDDDLFYRFGTVDDIKQRQQAGQLIQMAEYAGNWYATDRQEVSELLAQRWGICALVEHSIRHFTEAGFEIRVVKIVPEGQTIHRGAKRRAADEQRQKIPMDIAATIKNSFLPGGQAQAMADLQLFLGQMMI